MTEKIEKLLSELTLEEKAGLCSGKDWWRTKPVERLGIPSIMVSDGPSGLRTQQDNGEDENDSKISVSFPSGCAVASSFDRNLFNYEGTILGEEANNFGVSTLLGPAINIKRSPLCGRNFEYLSEDPYVSGELGAAYIKGVQSKNVGTSVKHFAANNQEYNRMSVDEIIDERTLREIYLPGFETCIKDANPATVMCSYNSVNGDLASENKTLLTDILRKDWGYKGLVMSDWCAVWNRVKGIKAGLNLEMPYPGGLTDQQIVAAVKDGTLSMEDLDKSVALVLEWIFNYEEHKQSGVFDMEKDHAESGKIATESCVLLKNEDRILPLTPDYLDSYEDSEYPYIGSDLLQDGGTLFVGYFAEEPRYGGGGSSKIRTYKMTNALQAAEEAGIKVRYVQGYNKDFVTTTAELTTQAIAAAQNARSVVVFAGLPESFESEGDDRKFLDMPEVQNELIKKIAEVNKNIIVVLHNGSPVTMPWINDVKAVLECYLGGENIGTAQINLLFGKANPCGKLAETFPLRLEDTPCYMNYPGNGRKAYYTEGVFVGYRWYDARKMPVLFPFGHGLSYTKFEYSNIRLSNTAVKDVDGVEVFVTIKNIGSCAGKEIVQLYVSDKTGVEVRPVKELKGFEKILLEPGEEKEVCFKLNKRSFAYWNTDIQDWYAPTGKYDILIGASSQDIRQTAELEVTSTSPRAFVITPQTTLGDMLRNKEMSELSAQARKAATAHIDAMTDEEFEAKFPFHKSAMISMLMANPFRYDLGRNGMTPEELAKKVEDLNKALLER